MSGDDNTPFNYDDFDSDSEGDDDEQECKVYYQAKSNPGYLTQGSELKWFKYKSTVYTLKTWYTNNYNSDPKNTGKVKDLSMYANGGAMQDDAKLSRYVDKQRNLLVITIKWNVGGGTDSKDDEKSVTNDIKKSNNSPFFSYKNKARKKVRKIPKKYKKNKKFPLSKEPCMVTLKKDSENNVYMPCKHTMSPSALFDYMLYSFIKNEYNFTIRCPKKKCNKRWPFKFCAAVTDLTDDEYATFTLEITKRKYPSKNCPYCGVSCDRPKNLKEFRVTCNICKKGEFCFECGKPWKSSGKVVCGNPLCYTNNINKILQNCGLCTSDQLKRYGIPKLRACPQCYEILQHAEACKHMTCNICGYQFCFICLKKWSCSNCTPVKGNPIIK